jgi:hypothetical protein
MSHADGPSKQPQNGVRRHGSDFAAAVGWAGSGAIGMAVLLSGGDPSSIVLRAAALFPFAAVMYWIGFCQGRVAARRGT